MEFSTASFIILLKIIAIDIVLSGDNAVVIAMATRRLPKGQQNKAILLGTAGAVVLRILFAILIIYLLKVPFVHLIGGLLLLYIAYNVLAGDDSEADIHSSGTLKKAVMTIIMADALMSLDNVVAIAGAAKGHIGMLILGVAVSIPIMIFGSKLIVRIMDKFSWIAYIGAAILAWTAADMIMEDKLVIDALHLDTNMEIYSLMALVTAALLVIGYLRNRRTN
ncbi:TerC family protein [Virgibacillus halophilus]|uniref:TerC family protein n=1 Tax=Tigheibacillus halophilus TaxID=361280 RepID=A0ABU5C8U9_9BACI|nr:TerC family protein [Virgibacillus halophilus]